MEIKVYVLHGHWDTMYERGVTVVCTEHHERDAIKKLAEIAETKGREYCELGEGEIEIEQTDTMLEIHDDIGFIGFYITEHKMELGDTLEELIYRNRKKKYLIEDAKYEVEEVYGDDEISRSEYEMAKNDPVIMETIADRFEEEEDCEVAFNDTMRRVTLETIRDFADCMG